MAGGIELAQGLAVPKGVDLGVKGGLLGAHFGFDRTDDRLLHPRTLGRGLDGGYRCTGRGSGNYQGEKNAHYPRLLAQQYMGKNAKSAWRGRFGACHVPWAQQFLAQSDSWR
jgi:hypothetical protein